MKTLAELKGELVSYQIALNKCARPEACKFTNQVIKQIKKDIVGTELLQGIGLNEKILNQTIVQCYEDSGYCLKDAECERALREVVYNIKREEKKMREREEKKMREREEKKDDSFARAGFAIVLIIVFVIVFTLMGCTQTVRGAFSDLGSVCNYVQEQVPATDSQ